MASVGGDLGGPGPPQSQGPLGCGITSTGRGQGGRTWGGFSTSQATPAGGRAPSSLTTPPEWVQCSSGWQGRGVGGTWDRPPCSQRKDHLPLPLPCAVQREVGGSDPWAEVQPSVYLDSTPPPPPPVALGHITCVSLRLSFPLCRPEANPGWVRLAIPSTQKAVWPKVTISSI